jgi:hypothetical protein
MVLRYLEPCPILSLIVAFNPHKGKTFVLARQVMAGTALG